MSTFEGKVIAVTGAASGIGLATAHLLASRGAKLSICDNREDALQSAVEAIQKASPSTDVLSRTVDVSKRDEVEAWLGATVEQFGKLHGAVNAAGIIADYPGKPVQEISDESWQKTLDVNLTGVFICMRDQLRRLEHGGSIVNISSVYGLMAAATAGAYAATKWAVIGLTKSAAKEVGERQIRINCVAPGAIDTPLVRNIGVTVDTPGLNFAIKRLGEAEEVASVIAFLLGDESKYVTGSTYCVDGGLLA